jgi:hypothetical protein
LVHGGGRGQVAGLGEAGQCRDVRLASGGDHVGAGAQVLAIDRDRGAVLEPGAAGDDLEPVDLGEVEVLVLAHLGDQLVLLPDQGGEVHWPSRRRQPGEGMRAGGMAGRGRSEQGLGRDAAHVHAGAAHGALFDHDDAAVAAAGFDGGAERGAA